ncbi:DM13 domain-containing protein [Aeoliella sp.]|uniref:DM13 domain-containing protein n=1 Tax=Aeoliella sp. TaxID=2795800 RepID=UPI003CCC206C
MSASSATAHVGRLWQATFAPGFHDVSGTVTVLDEDTLQFDNFTYDGGGIFVLFYLGETDSTDSFLNGLPVGDDLVGTAYDGTQPAFTVDLPAGTTIDGYHAISVWCVDVGVSFSSGTFQPQPVPEPATCVLAVVAVGLGWMRWRASK